MKINCYISSGTLIILWFYFVFSFFMLIFATEYQNEEVMTDAQLNAMNTELLQGIGAIADCEPLMKRLTKYVRKLVKERENDPTLMTKEELPSLACPPRRVRPWLIFLPSVRIFLLYNKRLQILAGA